MSDTYRNPVYPENFPDPFILKWRGEYWAYCTGQWRDGRCFGVLRSRDLVRWSEVGGALEPLPGDLPHYWAPEVSVFGGRFYMYYSAGVELEDMAIRVAVADHPAGPFYDAGVRLTSEPFAIDAHVFADQDGARYLFYATDYLGHTHIGTGTAVDRLVSPLELAGDSRPVVRARYDWQVYDPNRAEKGGVRWHTVEGSFVLLRKGRYYHMFSGGNWQNISYGVSYAVSDRIVRPDEWEQHADGEQVIPILRTIPGRVVGPGHNSVVRGPDNRQLFCVYHRWEPAGRAMAIDPLDWAGERMLVLGPSDEPRPAPSPPTLADYFDDRRAPGLGAAWECAGGTWQMAGGVALQASADGPAYARCAFKAACFVAEVSARAAGSGGQPPGESPGAYGLALEGQTGTLLFLRISPADRRVAVAWRGEDGWRQDDRALPAEFDAGRFELLRAEVDGQSVRLTLGEGAPAWSGRCAAPVQQLALYSDGCAAEFSGFAFTHGYEELFDEPGDAPSGRSWQVRSGSWRIREGALESDGGGAAIVKLHALESYALVANLRAADAAARCYGIYPAVGPERLGPLLAVERGAAGWDAVWVEEGGRRSHPLPEGFDPLAFQQWRLARRGDRISVAWEGHALGEFPAEPGPAAIGFAGLDRAVQIEMVRLTRL